MFGLEYQLFRYKFKNTMGGDCLRFIHCAILKPMPGMSAGKKCNCIEISGLHKGLNMRVRYRMLARSKFGPYFSLTIGCDADAGEVSHDNDWDCTQLMPSGTRCDCGRPPGSCVRFYCSDCNTNVCDVTFDFATATCQDCIRNKSQLRRFFHRIPNGTCHPSPRGPTGGVGGRWFRSKNVHTAKNLAVRQ